MKHKVEIDYGGAKLCLSFCQDKADSSASASLSINDIERENVDFGANSDTIKLSSTVQTEYEWHEFIEAIIELNEESIKASIWASKKLLKEIVIER